jgi:hypothetical protein
MDNVAGHKRHVQPGNIGIDVSHCVFKGEVFFGGARLNV